MYNQKDTEKYSVRISGDFVTSNTDDLIVDKSVSRFNWVYS